MKQLVSLLIAFTIGSSTLVFAQDQRQQQDRMQRGKDKIEQTKSDLDLNADQSRQWDEIHEKFFNDLQNLKSETGLTAEEKKAKGKKLRNEKDKSLKAILSDEQYTKFLEMRKQERQKMQKGNSNGINARPNNPKSSHKQQMKKELNLSSDQEVKWNAIQSTYKVKYQELRQDETISDEDRNVKLRSMRSELDAELMAILDSEQQATFTKQKAGMKNKRTQQRKGNKVEMND